MCPQAESVMSDVRVGKFVWMNRPRLRVTGTFVHNGQKKTFWADCFVYQNLDKSAGVVSLEVKGSDDFFAMSLSDCDKKVFEEAIISSYGDELKRIAEKKATEEEEDKNGSETCSNL